MALRGSENAAAITNGATTIVGGTNTRVLFDDSGVIGESAGLTYVKASGLLASTAMAIGGATIGPDALGVTGTATISGNLTLTSSKLFYGNGSGNTALLKAAGGTFQARVFADNAYTFLQGKITSEQNATTGLAAGVLAALTNATVVFYDATGQAYRFPCII